MLFVTDTFLLFFIVVYLAYWLVPFRFRVNLLIVASIYFYATWSALFAVHFVVVILINYYVMEYWRKSRKNWIFFTLQAANVLNIAVFKYYYLFADIVGFVARIDFLRAPLLREADRAAGTEILLPLAISFYTFQIMSYGIDIYRGTYTEKHSLREVVLFKTFFPQLIAGPIMRSSDLLPQIRECDEGKKLPDRSEMRHGLWYILFGIIKKMIIADSLLLLLAPAIAAPASKIVQFDPLHLWLLLLGAMFMLYADFSAYSDMARGFGYLLGFEIPINFAAPYFMKSISDFWRRWHLTFSYWIRDYIFIPLGGSRVREWRVYVNLIITFFIGGLWHGASYTFILWGTVTGVLLSIEAFLYKRGLEEWPASPLKRVVKLVITWIVFVPTAALFFGTGIDWSFAVIERMFTLTDIGADGLRHLAGAESISYSIVALLLFHLLEQYPSLLQRMRQHERWLLPLFAVVTIVAMTQFSTDKKDFFYFQF